MKHYELTEKCGFWLVKNFNGATLGIGDKTILLEVDGYAFKDLNHNGVLDPYEDWRLPIQDRISDLISRMEVEDIAGLMLYSIQQMASMVDPFAQLAFYGGTDETKKNPWDLNQQLRHILKDENMRHITLAVADSAEVAARWNNNLQAFAETLGLGIPVNISSDPRHTPSAKKAEFNMGAGEYISTWPDELGLAATFSPDIVREFGRIASVEYRAMGIATALSPQIDLATEPRWNRFSGTFGESTRLATEMARAYCDGFQTSEGKAGIYDGWGYESVNAMVKHWPGGGTGEGGRDAHFNYGKYAIYPGENFDEHLKPFTEGAFCLDGPTKTASAVMPYYTISYGQDNINNENVGNAYSKYIITDLLREKYGFDGVVCTDWGITTDPGQFDTFMGGKCWGVEHLSVVERHYKAMMAGIDQFGGNNNTAPILEAYQMGVKEQGEEWMRGRFEQTARRLLRNFYRIGLFENPYVDLEETKEVVNCTEFSLKGYEAQQKSVVLLKNKDNILPVSKSTKVYIPEKVQKPGIDWFGQPTPEHRYPAVDSVLASHYIIVVDNPEEADMAFVFTESPVSLGYKNGFVPINLQYRPYISSKTREKSITGEERSFKGMAAATDNDNELDILLNTKKIMGNKPVVVFLTMANPTVVSEFELIADAIVADFAVEKAVLLDIATGVCEPSGLLPCQLPKDMDTVDAQNEDVPFDMVPYTDSCGNTYDFAFGLNWKGVIKDERVIKYAR